MGWGEVILLKSQVLRWMVEGSKVGYQIPGWLMFRIT